MSRIASPWKPIFWGCGALATAGLVHGAVWLTSIDRLAVLLREPSGVLQEWTRHIVLAGPARPAGWPSRAGLEVGPVSILAGSLGWRAERVTASTALRWPWTSIGAIDVTPTGQRVRLGSDAERIVTSRKLTIQVTNDHARLQGVELKVAGLLEVQALQLRLGPGGLTAEARHLRLADAAGGPGPVIDALSLHAAPVPPIPLLENLRSSATAWQAAAGVLELSELTLTTASTQVSGNARAWLDAALQPRLDGVVHVTGYASALDELVTAGFLAAQTAVAAKAVLGLLAAPSVDGSVDIPVHVADGILTVAQFPLRRLPVLEWSAPVSGQ